MTKFATSVLLATTFVYFGGQSSSSAFAFTPTSSAVVHIRPSAVASSVILAAAGDSSSSNDAEAADVIPTASLVLSRRYLLSTAAAISASSSLLSYPIFSASAATAADAPTGTVVVVGATGQTGKRILDRLLSSSSAKIIAGVRNVSKATNALSSSSLVVKDALANKAIEFRSLDGKLSQLFSVNRLLIFCISFLYSFFPNKHTHARSLSISSKSIQLHPTPSNRSLPSSPRPPPSSSQSVSFLPTHSKWPRQPTRWIISGPLN